MKKQSILLVSTLILSLALTACSAGSSVGDSEMKSYTAVMPAAPGGGEGSGFYERGEPMTGTAPDAAPRPAPEQGPNAYDTASIKRILRADIEVQTTDFDGAIAALEKLVADQGGYFEDAQVQQGSYYDTSASRYGSYTVRVPQEQFEGFLAAAGEVGHLVNLSRSAQDVGQQYFNVETRLKTLRTQQERLLALLAKAETMENIIALQNALTDVEYQIEQYGTELRRYDSLIGYATVTVSLNEVLEITEQPKETVSLSGRIANAFVGGLSRFGRSMGDFAVWLAYNLVGVLIFLVVAAVVVAVVVRIRRKKRVEVLPPAVPHDSVEQDTEK